MSESRWKHPALRAVAVLGVLCVGACSSEEPEEPSGPTYYGDVAPILSEYCVNCHHSGGVAPFSLETYDDAVLQATRVALATRDRIMPPWLADASGACGDFHDPQWLTDAQIETIGAWVEAGTPEGDPSAGVPDPPVLPTVEDPDVVLDMGVDYSPGTTADDDYRCFVIDPGFAEDTFITGYEVVPGNPEIVHHVILYYLREESQEAELDALDAEEGPGYTCFGSAGLRAPPAVLWAPGIGATRFPEGTGIRIPAGRRVVMQVHYNVAGGGGTDRTTVKLETTADADVEAFWYPVADWDMEVPGRTAYVQTDAAETIDWSPSGRLQIYGAAPHMHTLGADLTLELERPDSTECLAHLPRWDFNWQRAYWYETPITVRNGDRLRITCGYDTTTRNEPVAWGDGTRDEMCLAFFYASL